MAKVLQKPPTVTIVVRNLPAGTTEDELLNLCSNCGGVAEVEIPTRASFYTKFIFAFVRFVSFDAALTAVTKLNGLMVQRRRLNVQLARSHWRNTNEKTVLHDETSNDDHEDESNLSEEDLNATILQICHQQWQQHRRRNRGRDLPSFGKIMEMISKSTDQEEEFPEAAYAYDIGQSLAEQSPAASSMQETFTMID